MLMTAGWKSRTGWAFVVAYLILAALLFYQALTCRDWVCDLVALPVALPLGFPISWLIDRIDFYFQIPGHVRSSHFRNWYFILPTVSANTIFYFWAGRLLETSASRLLRRFAKRR